ncbi:MAG: DUF1810 family protein [Bradyrhizobium sp.]|nr:MAG: DUF1810 family protein [Bradyrhizobium sp.]
MSGENSLQSDDPFELRRFVAAQATTYAAALAELRAGRKKSHWMWFVFPQMRGLGSSPMAEFYGVGSLDEAGAYLAHPLLGARLRESLAAVIAHANRPLAEILGSPDDLKFRSSMTLFARATGGGEPIFQQAIERCCGGEADLRTLALIDAQMRSG